MFGSSPGFRGSRLQQMVRHCGDQMRLASPKVFARAVLTEHAEAFEHLAKSDREKYPADSRAANKIADNFALVVCAHIALTADAVNAFGGELDRVAQSDSVKAVALANSLAAFAACPTLSNVSFANSDGGYRGYFTAFLVLRVAAARFGLLEPWQRIFANADTQEENRQFLHHTFEDVAICSFLRLTPRWEVSAITAIMRGLSSFDPHAPSQYNTLPAALNQPEEAVQRLLVPQVEQWLALGGLGALMGSRPHTRTGGGVSIQMYQDAINAGFTNFTRLF
jgi:hypothetical protein